MKIYLVFLGILLTSSNFLAFPVPVDGTSLNNSTSSEDFNDEDNVIPGSENEENVVGFGAICNEKILCNSSKILTCSNGQCECDTTDSQILHYSVELGKCVEEVDMPSEVDDDDWDKENIADEDHDEVDGHHSHSHSDHGDHEDENPDETEYEEKTIVIGGDGGEIGGPLVAPWCANDTQCHQRHGNYSKCNLNTGACDCFYPESKDSSTSKAMERIHDICYVRKTIGDPCANHQECKTVRGKAWCHADLETYLRSCECEPLNYWNDVLKECLPFGRSGVESYCKVDYQCTAPNALGNLSRCDVSTGQCECYDTVTDGETSVIYYDDTKRCYVEKDLLSVCNEDEECQASLGFNSLCSTHPDYEQKICQCMEGKDCEKRVFEKKVEERPKLSTFSLVVFILVGVCVLIGIVLCFVLRKNDRYDVVSQTPH